MEITLQKGKKKIRLPVNPEQIGYTHNNNYEDVVLASGDEKSRHSGRLLRDYMITTHYPEKYYPYCNFKPTMKPKDFVKLIKSWQDDDGICKLTVSTTNINEDVSIRTFEQNNKAGSGKDVWFTLTMKEHEPITVRKVVKKKKDNGKKKNTNRKTTTKSKVPKTYIVKQNDNLSSISKKLYGDSSQWRKIYNANKKLIGKNYNLIKIGWKLTIPS